MIVKPGSRRTPKWRRRLTTLTLVLVLSGAGSAVAANVPTPPFKECPPVGASPSCKLLVVINADRTVSVLPDPAIGPYDGGDDTMVGVLNKSSTAVDAITVWGPGSDLGGFDGDGLCTFGVVGCPFGLTGYEGPNTVLKSNPANFDEAEVDFSVGLASGRTAYFSLEGALTAAQLTASRGTLGGYAAIGDSYSAGEGTGDYQYGTGTGNNHCDRSPHGYGPLLDSDRALGTLTFTACSGALTADFVNPNHAGNVNAQTGGIEPAQLSTLKSTTKTITFTIGGNDVGFAYLAKKCFFGRVALWAVQGESGCSQDFNLTTATQQRIEALAGTASATTPEGNVAIHSIASLLETAHVDSPNARIYVAGYPELLAPFAGECQVGKAIAHNVKKGPFSIGTVNVAIKVTGEDAAWLDTVAARLNAAIKQGAFEAAQATGADIQYVDVNGAFGPHKLCAKGALPWIKSLSLEVDAATKTVTSTDPGSLHPTPEGQRRGYEQAFLATNIGQ